jgi:hypothetical protein
LKTRSSPLESIFFWARQLPSFVCFTHPSILVVSFMSLLIKTLAFSWLSIDPCSRCLPLQSHCALIFLVKSKFVSFQTKHMTMIFLFLWRSFKYQMPSWPGKTTDFC